MLDAVFNYFSVKNLGRNIWKSNMGLMNIIKRQDD